MKNEEQDLNKEQISNSIKADVIRCQSLTYFAENYLLIKDKDGNERKLDDASMEMLKMIEEAQKQGCTLKRAWMRNKYKWVMVKDWLRIAKKYWRRRGNRSRQAEITTKSKIENMKPKLSTSSPAFANINVGGRAWRFEKFCMKGEYQIWTAHYWCPDGDGIELYIAEDHFELSCFSGIGSSVIKMSDLDFTYLQDKVKDLDFRQPFVIQAVKVADYFCQLFCEFTDVSDYKDVSQ